MRRADVLLLALAGAVVVFVWSRSKQGQQAAGDALEFVVVTAQKIFAWSPPAAAAPYLEAIDRAERENGLPHHLLARLLYQESRFREDIITGATVSSAGAMGIAQIVPKWHPGVDPLDPFASIDYAARYLRQLFNQFGDWKLALAAYNAGPGNVTKHGGIPPFAETQAYVAEIARDVGLA